jgi:hypothetical protein
VSPSGVGSDATLVALEHRGVLVGEHLGLQRLVDDLLDLLREGQMSAR